MGFPLLLNKAFAEVKKQGVGVWTRWTLLGHVHSGQVRFPLLLNKALPESRSMDWTIAQGALCREGHVQSGQVGFPLLLNKALAGVKKHGLDDCTRWTL